MRRLPPIFALLAMSLMAHITMSGGRVSASLFALQHNDSNLMAGLAYGMYSLLPALASIHMGRWVDRAGPQRVMNTSLVVMMCGLALPAMWPNLPTVLVSAALGGFGFSSYILAANVAVSFMPVQHSSERVGMLAWLQIGTSISAVFGPSIAGTLIDHAGYRVVFAFMAVAVGVSFVLSRRIQLPEGGSRPKKHASVAAVFGEVARTPALLRIYLIALALSLAWDGFSFMAPVLGHERGYTASQVGIVLSTFACGTLLIRMALPWLSRRLPEWRMLSVACAVTATVFLLLPIAHSVFLHAALGFLYGLSAGVGQPNILNLIYHSMPPEKAGQGVGLRSMIAGISGLGGPWLFGIIAGLLSAAPVFLLIGCVMGSASWQAHRAAASVAKD
ncbi:MFS transporter [Uliginosibacterium sp. sgz301328]|uniref:MFS transporter n=1 Tax=Uliginosibacterium sp. sgz301328 TaxID=3243764 RepID=UPI00359EC51E